MTAAAEGAEAYLRLMAEAELRRALAYPRYEPEQPPGLPPAVRSAVRLSGPLLAPLLPPVRSMARVSGPLLASLWPAARTAAAAARQTPAGRAAEPVLWRALRVRHAVRPLRPGRGRFTKPPAQAGLDRLRQVAAALVGAGAIGEDTAQAVLDRLADALAIRGKLTAGRAYRPLSPGAWGLGSPRTPASPPPSLPAGPVRAVPIGRTLPLGADGELGEASLLALVLAPDRAVITAAASPARAAASPPRPDRRPPSPLPFSHLVATDDHGAQYRSDYVASSTPGRQSLAFDLTPVPPAGTRWLDISGRVIPRPVRADLACPAPAGHVPDRDLPRPGGLPRLSPGERPLDTLAERLLAEATDGHSRGDRMVSGLPDVVAALQASAGLAAGSAALSRLATLAGRLGIDFPAGLRPLVRPVELPAAWVSVLDHRGAADGPDGVAPVAAVLPEVDGARFALAGLDSVAGSATLRVVAWGWQPGPLTALGGERFSWWARDDRGRWHLALEHGAHYGGGQVDLLVEFGPALHPGATSLEFIVRGPASQAAVTLPLHWLASR